MLQLNLRKLFDAKGVRAPFTWLVKQGIARNTAADLLNGKAYRLRIDHLTLICRGLRCTPDDVFSYADDSRARTDERHPLQQLKANATLPDIGSQLNGLSVEQIKLLEEKVREMRG